MPLASLRDVVLSVQEGRVERALAPVENALEGGVDPVLDALALEAPDVALVGEVVQPVSYCLAAGRELPLAEITMVLSHPQALGQCTRWLARAPAERGAGAGGVDRRRACARSPASATGTRAAIGPRLAAAPLRRGDARRGPRGRPRQRHPLRLARTRRGRAAAAATAARRRRRSSSGAPARARRAGSSPAWPCSRSPGVNLTRIESRPLRRGMGEYMFFLDLEGSMADPAVSGAVARPTQARRGGSSPRLVRNIKTVRAWPLHSGSDGKRRTPRPTGVRAARRPPAART